MEESKKNAIKQDVLLKISEVIDRYKSDSKIAFSHDMMSEIFIRANAHVGFSIDIGSEKERDFIGIKTSCESAIMEIEDIKKVTIVLTADVTGKVNEEVSDSPDLAEDYKHKSKRLTRTKNMPPIYLISSGKGGVGKSTFATNFACALSSFNIKVGLIDADIYGPSIPKMLNCHQEPEVVGEKIMPVSAHGIQFISSALFTKDSNQAFVWRAPMVMKMITNMISGVDWSGVEILIIDLPPGTGDINITLAKSFPITGGIIITTPQLISIVDVRKSIDMFRKLDIPIVGLVENMSYFVDPKTFQKSFIFGKDGGKELAKEEGIEFLGDIPIDAEIGVHSDQGTPIVVGQDSSETKAIFHEIAKSFLG